MTGEMRTGKRVYLAGPMRHYKNFNQEAFIEGARRLREAGHEVWSPYEDNIAMGLDTTGMSGDQAEAERIRRRSGLPSNASRRACRGQRERWRAGSGRRCGCGC